MGQFTARLGLDLVLRGTVSDRQQPGRVFTVEVQDGAGQVLARAQTEPGGGPLPDAAQRYEIKLPEALLDGQLRQLAVHVVGRHGGGIALPVSLSPAGIGLVEQITPDHISGWAINLKQPQHSADVVAAAAGKILGRASADGFCGGLTQWVQSSGFHGFHIPLEQPLSAAERAGLKVQIYGQDVALAFAPGAGDVADPPPSALLPAPSRFDAGLDRITPEGVSGWLLDRESTGQNLPLGLHIDGELVERVQVDGWREDRGRCGFWIAFPPGLDLTQARDISLRLPEATTALPELTQRWAARRIGRSHISLDPGASVWRDPDPVRLPLPQDPASPALTVAIIVLNLNGAGHLEALFASFAAHNRYPHYRFIIIDHGSSDGSVAVCQRWSAQLNIDVQCRGQNYSFSQSNNYGVALAEEDIVFFLNNDIILDRCLLTPLLRCFVDDSIGIVGLKLVSPATGEDGGLVPGFVQHLGVKFGLRPDRPPVSPYELPLCQETRGISETAWEVPAVTAAAMALRRVDFDRVGGFDERYFYGYEDVDFCLAARRVLNKRIVCANHIQAYHIRGATRTAQDQAARRRYVKNQDLLAARFGADVRQATRRDMVAGGRFWRQNSLRIAFVVSAVETANPACDFHHAFELGKALMSELGWQVSYLPPEDWYSLDGFDVVVVMEVDWSAARVTTGNPNLTFVAWAGHRVEHWFDHPWLQQFDLIWAASDRARQVFSGRVSVPVEVMRPAVDPERFCPDPAGPGGLSDYCFDGHFHHTPGQLVTQLETETLSYRFALYGDNWSNIAWLEPYWRGELPDEERPAVYAGSYLVLDEATACGRRWGGLSPRVFEALAAGALVITNNLRGAQEVFGGQLPVCRSGDEMQGVIRYYLEHPQERQTLVAQLRTVVLTEHSIQARAGAVRAAVQRLFGDLRFSVRCLDRPGQERDCAPLAISTLVSDQLRQQEVGVRLLDPRTNLPSSMLLGDDVVLHVSTGPAVNRFLLRPDQVHLRLHFGSAEDLSPAEAARYDGVLLASETESEVLRGARGPVLTLFPDRATQQECYRVDPASGELRYGDARPMLAALQRVLPELAALARRLNRTKYQQDIQREPEDLVAPASIRRAARAAPVEQQIEIGPGGPQRRCLVAAPVPPATGRVAVVVLHYQHVEDTLRCVTALLQQSYGGQHIYIVSNDAGRAAFDHFVTQFPECTVIQSPENLGYAGGNNIALALARLRGFDLLWLVNPDTVAPPEYLEKMVDLADLHPEISILGSTILYGDRPDTVWFGGGFVHWEDGLDARHGHIGWHVDHLPETPIPCDYVTGASLILRSSVLQDVGYFPEEYFLYFEETRWCLDAAAKGHRIATFPQVVLYHHKRSEQGGAPSPVFLYYYVRNGLTLCRRLQPDKLAATTARLRRLTEMLLAKVARHAPERLAASRCAVDTGFQDGVAGGRGKMDPEHYMGVGGKGRPGCPGGAGQPG